MNLNPELQDKIDPLTGMTYMNVQDRVNSKMISYSLARQEYLNEAVSDVANSVYGYEITKLENDAKIGDYQFEGEPVYTFWDLGMDDPTAIVFAQKRGDKLQVIDYYENTGHDIKHYIDIIQEKDYQYAGHYMPHDAKKRSNSTGINILDFCRTEFSFEVRPIPKTNSVRDDIEIVRRNLPDICINGRCVRLLECLKNYQWNPVTGRILHNEYSHGADAIRMMFMALHHGMIHDYLTNSKKKPRIEYYEDMDFIV
jgi:hypothetical protein